MNYREIYTAAHGLIPAGHVVHHIDGDRNNNAIENLRAMSASDHRRLHSASRIKPRQVTMTGSDLERVMLRLRFSCAKVGWLSGMTRAYVSQLLADPEETIPETTFAKLRAGFLKYHKDVADTYFAIESEAVA